MSKKNQVIKKYVDIFDDFVTSHFTHENNYYIFNNLVFKKITYEGHINIFLEQLKNYYYKNKYFYIEQPEISHNQFNTILRQICKNNNIHIEIKLNMKIQNMSRVSYIFGQFQLIHITSRRWRCQRFTFSGKAFFHFITCRL